MLQVRLLKSNPFLYLCSLFQNTMIDFVLAVENPLEWHSRNLDKNPSHYSMLKYVGPKYISKVQNSFGAKVYYNTLIPTQNGVSIFSDL